MTGSSTRAIIGGLLLVVGLIVGWFGHKAMMGPSDVPRIAIYQDWRLACPATSDKDGTCQMQQDVLDNKTRSELARFTVFRTKDAKTMLITVPFNVLLEAGMGVGLGNDKPRIYQFETCNEAGCIVRVPVDDALWNAIGAAPQARILVAGLDGKAVGLPFSLKGFHEASDAFADAEAQRRSWWSRLWS